MTKFKVLTFLGIITAIFMLTLNFTPKLHANEDISGSTWQFNDTIEFSGISGLGSAYQFTIDSTGYLEYEGVKTYFTQYVFVDGQSGASASVRYDSQTGSTTRIFWAYNGWQTGFGPGTKIHFDTATSVPDMAMIWLRYNATEIIVTIGDWTFNQQLNFTNDTTYLFTDLDFVCNGVLYDTIKVEDNKMFYINGNNELLAYSSGLWVNSQYRLIYINDANNNTEFINFMMEYAIVGNYLPVRVSGWFTFNDIPVSSAPIGTQLSVNISFACNNGVYSRLTIGTTNEGNTEIYFDNTKVYDTTNGWIDPVYQRIIISSAYISTDDYDLMLAVGVFAYEYTPTDDSFADIVFSIADVPFKTLSNLLSFSLFGVTFFAAVCSFFLVLLLAWLIKKVI